MVFEIKNKTNLDGFILLKGICVLVQDSNIIESLIRERDLNQTGSSPNEN